MLFRPFVATLATVATASAQTSVSVQPPPPGIPTPNPVYADGASPNPAAAVGTQPNQTSPPFYPAPWAAGTGAWAQAYKQATQFVSQLTLAEKVNLTTGTGWSTEACVGNTGSIPRLNFSSFCLQDSPLGIRFADFVSAFPAGLNVAATWSRSLAQARGAAMGAEHRTKGVDVQLGPVAGPIGRSPEGGRNWEGFSPDPVLTGVMMAQTIQGIQGEGVIACAKHFVGNEQEHFRQAGQVGFATNESSSSNIDDATMHELYAWPFADAVRAGVGSVMCSYNRVNNSYACQNSWLQNYLLKSELDFQGFIVSDWTAQLTGVASTLAGLDMTMPGDTAFDSGRSFWGANLTASVLNGTVPQWRLDDMVVRIMSAYYLVGRDRARVPVNFNSWSTSTTGALHFQPGPQAGVGVINQHINAQYNHRDLIRQIGSASTVLLKNVNRTLPLKGNETLTGIFGEDAGSNAYGANGCPDRGCDNGTLAMGWGSGTANFPYLVTPEQAITNVVLQNGASVEAITDNYAATQIKALASRASVAIVFANADSGEGYINVDGNIGDRNNLTLWGGADTLIQNVSAICNNTIVVLHTVGPVLIDAYANNPNITAILWAGLPGQESGNSIADVLYGNVNPGAKLPFSMAKTREDFGTDVLYAVSPNQTTSPQIGFTEGIFIDYKHLDYANKTPTYEFGFGLSYTNFSFANLQVTRVSTSNYTANTGSTAPAPTFGASANTSASSVLAPGNGTNGSDWRIPVYIYPYLNSTNLSQATNDSTYGLNYSWPQGSSDGSPQPQVPAGGAPGGNNGLYDVLYRVSCTITNNGTLNGEEVPQVYVSLGGPYDPKLQLRAFDRLSLVAGSTVSFTAELTRRDLSNWDSVSQNWVITPYNKTVYVGNSSRKLPLQAALPM